MIAPAEEVSHGLPFSLEAEMSVVGGMFVESEMIPVALDLVSEKDFHRDQNRRVFKALVALYDRNVAVDSTTLVEQLRQAGDLDAVGGVLYLAELLDAVPSASNIEYHCRIVAKYAARRRLIDASQQIKQFAVSGGDDSAEQMQATAEQLIASAAPRVVDGGLISLRDLLPGELARWESLEKDRTIPIGIRTGLRAVDDKLGPMEAGDLVIVAARPSMGKSAWGINNIAADAAIRQGKLTAVFSVETPRNRLVSRLIASEGRVNMAAAKMRRGFNEDEYPRLAQAAGILNIDRLLIDHTPGLTVDQARVRARKLIQARGPIGLAVFDYLQMMVHPRAKDTRDEVAKIGAGLKRFAQEFECVVVALSQLSRAVEARPDKRPMLSDLRESGTLEQDADVIMLLYRPEYYFGSTMEVRRGKEKQTVNIEGKAEIILGKVRDGATGTAACLFEKEYTYFMDWR